jgi:hypothetical protein
MIGDRAGIVRVKIFREGAAEVCACAVQEIVDAGGAQASSNDTFSPNRPGASSGRTGLALPM